MYLGVDYYPEQWDIEMMEQDLDNILELGCNTIRIGEFAWHMMERTEGNYDFSYFDNVIKKAKEKGLKIVFGTPTATMPAWLAKQYPEVLSEFEDGSKRVFGGRRQYCFNSAKYYEHTSKMVKALVEHYKDEDGIIAWQIDNEFGHEGSDVCYCENCQKKFQDYLSTIYRDIDELNDIYGTRFWSQGYNDFDEIPTPNRTITTHNPSLRMDWERFRSKSVVDYLRFQYDIVKSIIPNAIVFHDFSGGGMEKHFDFSDVASYLDLVAYNNYPVWGGQKEPILPHEIAFSLDYMRGLKQQNFWITEAIMGAQGHDITGYLPRPNQAKMWSYQGVAHGCQSMMYFRYRGATKGAEQFCYGILDADNVKRRKFYEVQSFYQDMKTHQQLFEAPIYSEVCIIHDYESMASFRIQQQSILIHYENELKKLYKPFYDANVSVDLLASREDFSNYKVVVIPLMIVWSADFQKRVKAYVEQGGCVIFTYRTAVKDIHNNLTLNELLPNHYTDLTGMYVVETESLQEESCLELAGIGCYGGQLLRAGAFREMLVLDGAKALFLYNDEFYQEYAAITVNHFGKGKAYYIGCSLTEDSTKFVIDRIIAENEIKTIASPDGVEVIRRTVENQSYYVIMNHNAKEVLYDNEVLKPFEAKIKKK